MFGKIIPKNDDEGGNSTTDEEPTTTTDDTAASANDKSPQGPMPKLRKRDSLVSVNSLLAKQDELREMMTLIVTAHLLFDKNATGIIMRTDVEKILSSQDSISSSSKLKKKSNPLINDERWKEMDWNTDGSIDFAEFVFTFTSWVSALEDDEEGDEE